MSNRIIIRGLGALALLAGGLFLGGCAAEPANRAQAYSPAPDVAQLRYETWSGNSAMPDHANAFGQ